VSARQSTKPIDADDAIQIPGELAVLPVSDAVIFPYMMVPLVLSDPDLLQLADDVLADSRVLGAFTQLPPSEEEEEEAESADAELYEVGTAVVIQKMLRFPDGNMRLLGQGIARIQRKRTMRTEPYMVSEIEIMDEPQPADAKDHGLHARRHEQLREDRRRFRKPFRRAEDRRDESRRAGPAC
jgi:ATP-dependent Lon protease